MRASTVRGSVMATRRINAGRRALIAGAAASAVAAVTRAQAQAPITEPQTRLAETSAHQVIDPIEADALSKLGAQYSALYRTEDFLEGRRAEAEGRPPKYQGK